MKESILKSIMRLFAIVSQVHSIEETEIARKVVGDYLKLIIRKDKIQQFLIMYDFYHNNLREREVMTGQKQLSLLSVKAVIICDQVNKFIDRKQKIFILSNILEVLSLTGHNKRSDIDFIRTIAHGFKIEEKIFSDSMNFVFGELDKINNKRNVLIIDSEGPKEIFRYVFRDFLKGKLIFQYIADADICLFRHIINNDQLYYNDMEIVLNKTYIFERGAVIKSPLMGSVFYNEVIKTFLHPQNDARVFFVAKELEYQFPNSHEGIKKFNLSEESGQIIGIMGGSGVGKSTLLNLMNGNIKPKSGNVYLNGHDIHNESMNIQGLIGFVPQDDMLIEELTVFQNLYYNAKLCFANMEQEQIIRRISRVMYNLGLFEIRNLKVGSPLNKFISGGQRKRLNIALELMREPQVLFVDEPTSGLSSNDSEKVVELLKHQSLKGKLIIVNIHQPSSDIFKKFDKLIIMDKGGRLVFNGNPLDSITYLKSYKQLINADEGECPTCGNLNPEQILQILEAKNVNEFGDYTSERQIHPQEWYDNYIKDHNKEFSTGSTLKLDLPKSEFKTPDKLTQFKIFSLRNILSKISDKQYLLINLLEAPVLAFILGWFTKNNVGYTGNSQAYIFSLNNNMPVYLFMAVVVALFLGLMVSAEEIIRDSKILKREEFLHLSRRSYYNSKTVFIGTVLAFQMLLFILVGNTILEIKNMYFKYWLQLWIVSMVAGIVGLNLSSTLKTVVAIYILIPILLVPQILLGGAMIKFDHLNSKLTHPEYVPIVGDIIPSRWAYEALSVEQFVNNKYQKQLYRYERSVSEASFMLNYYIPEIKEVLSRLKKKVLRGNINYNVNNEVEILRNAVGKLSGYGLKYDGSIDVVNSNNLNNSTFNIIDNYLKYSREYFIKLLDVSINERDKKIYNLEKKVGGREALLELIKDHHNESLSDLVISKNEIVKISVIDNKIIQKADPVYNYPEMRYGRAHFFSPVKRLGNYYIDTYWFNIIVLFLFFLFFYLTLLNNIFTKVTNAVNKKTLNWLIYKAKIRLHNILRPIMR